MKIHWNQNPLKSFIELDSISTKLMKEREIKEELLESILTGIHMIEEGVEVDWSVYRDRIYDIAFDDGTAPVYEKHLHGVHIGDCTQDAATCMKCYSESLVDASTIDEFSFKSPRFYWRWFVGVETIEEAIAVAEEIVSQPIVYDKNSAWEKAGGEEEFSKHIPRWAEERAKALEELKAYRDKHQHEWSNGDV